MIVEYIELPKRIDFEDYHEIKGFEDNVRKLNPKLRVKEIGLLGGNYVGVVFSSGSFSDGETQELIRKIRDGIRKEEKEEEIE